MKKLPHPQIEIDIERQNHTTPIFLFLDLMRTNTPKRREVMPAKRPESAKGVMRVSLKMVAWIPRHKLFSD